MTNILFMEKGKEGREKGKEGREKGKAAPPHKRHEVLPFPLIPSLFLFSMGTQ